MDLSKAIEMVVEEFKTGKPGETDPTKFMKYVASVESDYGNYDMDDALSYGAFQIDPIRYYDITQNPTKGRVNPKLISQANEFLKSHGKNVDISKLAVYDKDTNKYSSKSKQAIMHDPLINAVLMRLALKQDIHNQVPTDNEEMSKYYQEFWGPKWSQSQDEDYKSEMRKNATNKFLDYHPEYTQPKITTPTIDSMKVESRVFDTMVNSTKGIELS